MMRLMLLGTAAAEAWPAPFCRCDACTEARRRRGPNLRSRAGALLDDDLKIDYGPDTTLQLQRTGLELSTLQALLFTHAHPDHLAASELRYMTGAATHSPPLQPMPLYASRHVIERIRNSSADDRARFDFHVLKPLEEQTLFTGDRLLPLPAAHAGGALLFRLTRGLRTLFYGHDSGLYPSATLDALGEGPALDIALLECTSGGVPSDNAGHLNIDGVRRMVTELRRRDVVTDATRVVATHFSHNGGVLHEELVHTFRADGIEVAYDGMVVEV